MRNIKIILSMLLVLVLACTAAIAEADDKYAVDGEKTILIDRDDFCLYLTGDHTANDNCNGISGNFMFKLNCVVENKTSQVIDGVSYTGVINGWSLGSNYTMSGTNDIQPGTKTKSAIWFTTEDTEVGSFEELESMSLTVTVKDENYKDMFTAETGTIHFHATAPVEEAAAETAPAAEEQTETTAVEPAPTAEPTPTPAPTEEPAKYETLQKGSKGDKVKEMQVYLKALGYLSGTADGDFGPGTEKAVKAFQSAEGIEATGIADSKTQEKLYNKELPKKQDLNVKISRLSDNSIGTPEICVRFTNASDRAIDRIDFVVYAYDAYGDLIRPYNRYDCTGCFYDSSVLKPGNTTPSDWYWTLYDCDGAVKVRVAIEKYHFDDGETVSVPYSDYVWYTYEK